MYEDCSLFAGSSLLLSLHQCGYLSNASAKTSGDVSRRSPPIQARLPPTEWKMSSKEDTERGSGLLSGLVVGEEGLFLKKIKDKRDFVCSRTRKIKTVDFTRGSWQLRSGKKKPPPPSITSPYNSQLSTLTVS